MNSKLKLKRELVKWTTGEKKIFGLSIQKKDGKYKNEWKKKMEHREIL